MMGAVSCNLRRISNWPIKRRGLCCTFDPVRGLELFELVVRWLNLYVQDWGTHSIGCSLSRVQRPDRVVLPQGIESVAKVQGRWA